MRTRSRLMLSVATVAVALLSTLSGETAHAADVGAEDALESPQAKLDVTPRLHSAADLTLPEADLDAAAGMSDEPGERIELNAAAVDSGIPAELDGLRRDVDDVAEHRRQALLERIARALIEPGEDVGRLEIRRRLADLIRDSSELAIMADETALELEAYSLHMQALHGYVTMFPHDPRVPSYLERLRATAKQARAVSEPQAKAVGDFWLLTVDLVKVARAGVSVDEQRERMEPLLEQYIQQHGDHPARYAVQQMLRELRSVQSSAPTGTPELAPAEPSEPLQSPDGDVEVEVDDAPSEQPAFRVPFSDFEDDDAADVP